jgi:hypothetical protein
MTTNVSIYDFRNWFLSSDPYKNNFSYEGLNALFEYLEECEESTGETIEFDPIAIACHYSEYKNSIEASDQYGRYYDIDESEEKKEKDALKFLEDNTQVIKFDGGVIIQDF